MGANVSAGTLLLCDTTNFDGPSTRPRLDDVPESCIALVLAHLDPLDIAKLARLNRAFRGASSADFIWESKLPCNYESILERVFDHDEYKTLLGLRKKDVYASLCRRVLFDGGTKEVWLDKKTGGVCLSISSKGLSITGIDDRRYWNHISTEESRFQTVAYLHQIWWLEVDGELDFPFPEGTYSVFFRLHLGKSSKKLGRRICNTEHIHGWDVKPVRFRLSTSDGQKAESKCFLDKPGNWVHYHVGDFEIHKPNEAINIQYSLTQIDCTHIKGGLCVDSVLICPSGVSSEYVYNQREHVNTGRCTQWGL